MAGNDGGVSIQGKCIGSEKRTFSPSTRRNEIPSGLGGAGVAAPNNEAMPPGRTGEFGSADPNSEAKEKLFGTGKGSSGFDDAFVNASMNPDTFDSGGANNDVKKSGSSGSWPMIKLQFPW